MTKILKAIRGLENLKSLNPANLKDIDTAEQALGVYFADDYKEYVQEHGAILAKGIELTGVVKNPRFNVVTVTKRARQRNRHIPLGGYVIEDIGIDGIFIIQNAIGAIYSINGNGELKYVCESLGDYIEQSRISS